MSISLICDQCGATPNDDTPIDCAHCGEEWCDQCSPVNIVYCDGCGRYYCHECAESVCSVDGCEYCGHELSMESEE